MKKQVLLLTGILVMVAGVAAAPQPGLTIEQVTPTQIAPGDSVQIQVIARNDGQTGADFDAVQVDTPPGIELTGRSETLRNSFRLCGGCQQVGTIYLAIADNAVSGTYPVTLRLVSGSFSVVETAELEVDGTPNIILNTSRVQVMPGKETNVAVTVSNIGTEAAEQTTVSFDADGLAMDPSILDMGRIPAGERVTRSVVLSADTNTAAGLQRSTYEISYRDDGSAVTKTVSAPVHVLEEAGLTLSAVEVDGLVVGARGSALIKLENVGPGTAERIAATLDCDGGTVHTPDTFVGQLEEDERVPLRFAMTPSTETVRCQLTYTYTDSRSRTQTTDITLSAQREGINPVFLLAGTGILLIAGYLVWRRRKDDEAAPV